MRTLIVLSLFIVYSYAIGNGLAVTPPMGWRSWNQFQCNGFPNIGKEFDQHLVMHIIDALVDTTRKVDGVPTSLRDIGFERAGLDDCWQLCNSGPGHQGWHDANGNPIVNTSRFTDLKALTDYAHNKGIKAGWYMNNCVCHSTCTSVQCFEGDAKAVAMYGFDSVKIDSCSSERNISLWSRLLNQTGRPILIENCHNTPPVPDKNKTPMQQDFNFFRTSDDIRPTYGTVLRNLQTVREWVPYVGPGCWSYPDMLEVGVTNAQGDIPTLTLTESRSHFGAWCVVSSPLILGFDLTDPNVMDSVWDIITNKEAIAVNQAWADHPGDLVKSSTTIIDFDHCGWDDSRCSIPSWQVWAKPIRRQNQNNLEVAVLLMNNDQIPQDVIVEFTDLNIGRNCLVRDIWAHKDLGAFSDSFTAHNLGSHDSAFITLTLSTSEDFTILGK